MLSQILNDIALAFLFVVVVFYLLAMIRMIGVAKKIARLDSNFIEGHHGFIEFLGAKPRNLSIKLNLVV